LKLPPQILRTLSNDAEARYLLENPLDYPGLVTRPRSKVLLRVWRYPSFEPQCSWAIIEAEDELFLRRVIRGPSGTYGSETPFEKPAYDNLATDLGNIQVTPFEADESLGLDGTWYGIERVSSHITATIRWWGCPPSKWPALERWHQKSTEIFDSVLPMSTVDIEAPSGRPR